MKGESPPPWLELLLATQFFAICTIHVSSSRNDCNLFCIDCESPQAAICNYCRSCHHSSHRVIQIRRSSYQSVVKVADLEDILDISDVQTYVINSATVVFLHERPQPRAAVRASSALYNCEICKRGLLDGFRFCSLSCSLKGIKEDMETTVGTRNISDCAKKDDEPDCSNEIANTRNNECNGSNDDCSKERPPPTRVIRRHRRKGIPRRAPFY
ncbi:hypothetical protein BRADI_2g41235v3 [Brachypodium distachyon]|uniref:B box-type domain-containing protein n=1 Tax=Brachypodium distachyon TaxID=15368 RepID=A0A0Q3KBN5_BRADI|nr:hypothetical protein BRADI_2g41235v3 [Brachypodium distachyon]